MDIKIVPYEDIFKKKVGYLERPEKIKKKCCACGQELPMSDFWWATTKMGKKRPLSKCKKCLLKIHRESESYKKYRKVLYDSMTDEEYASMLDYHRQRFKKEYNDFKNLSGCLKKQPIIIVCKTCGKKFGVTQRRWDRRLEKNGSHEPKYCSRACQFESMRKKDDLHIRYRARPQNDINFKTIPR